MNLAVITVRPDQDIATLAEIMISRRMGGLLVEEKGRIVGLVTEADISNAVYA
jgi:CBS domain-containing protein